MQRLRIINGCFIQMISGTTVEADNKIDTIAVGKIHVALFQVAIQIEI